MSQNDATITAAAAWPAYDSRGRPTVGCRVETAGGAFGRCIVPSGASTGTFEAVERRDGGTAFGGWGVQRAVDSVNLTLRDAVIGMDCEDQRALDAALESADGTDNLGNLGANAVLAVSVAALNAAAANARRPLYEVLSQERPVLLPTPMVNIVSGGAHAGGIVDIQDVLVVPVGAPSFAKAIEWVWQVRTAAAEIFEDRGLSSALVADEGGLAGALRSNEEAIEIVAGAIERAGFVLGDDLAIAVDLAANQLTSPDGRIRLASEGRSCDTEEWLSIVHGWLDRYPIVSIEDVVADQDWAAWTRASAQFNSLTQLLGDDLFVTNAALIERGISSGVANAVLIKPNQAGSVTRTADALAKARSGGYATVVSARSGDTEDTWLADLAVGWGAGQIKVGSMTRSERLAKWNRVLEIEAQLGSDAVFLGGQPLASAR